MAHRGPASRRRVGDRTQRPSVGTDAATETPVCAFSACLNRYDTSSCRQTWCTSQVGKGCPKPSEPWSPAPVCAAAIFADTANTSQYPVACNPSPGTLGHPLARAPPAPSDTRPKPAPAPPIEPVALESPPCPNTVIGTRAEIKAGLIDLLSLSLFLSLSLSL